MDASTYIKSIRNPAKKLYALRYWDWLLRKRPTRPEAPDLSYMAAQAVRLRLMEIADQNLVR